MVSPVEDFTKGSFKTLIPDEFVSSEKATKLVFCSGKFYYDLLKQREELKRDDVALVRLEQLFPLPMKEIRSQLKQYNKATDVVWAQEEPRNMGAWSHLLLHMPEASNFDQLPAVFMEPQRREVPLDRPKDTKKSSTMSLTKQKIISFVNKLIH